MHVLPVVFLCLLPFRQGHISVQCAAVACSTVFDGVSHQEELAGGLLLIGAGAGKNIIFFRVTYLMYSCNAMD